MTTGELLARVAGVLMLATVLGGCGQGGAAPDVNGLAKTEEIGQAAVHFAQCMRDRGYQVPDPTFNEEGLPVWGDMSGVPDKGPEFDQVNESCREPLTAAYQAAGVPNRKTVATAELLGFARCMREHGVDIPDPSEEEPLSIPKNAHNSPAWQPAVQACESQLPESWRAAVRTPPGADVKNGGGR